MSEAYGRRLRTLVPTWKSVPLSTIQHYHIPDHGNMGLTIETKDNFLDIQPVKANSQSCMGAKMCAMPLLPPNENGIAARKSSDISDLNSLTWQRILQANKQQLLKNPSTEKELKDILSKLSSQADIVMKIPQFLYKMARKIPEGITSEGKHLDEFELKNGGGLHYQPLFRHTHDGVLLHCTGKNMADLAIIPMSVDVQNTTTCLIPKLNISEYTSFPNKIYQVTSQQLSQTLYCGIRRANKVDVGKLNFNSDAPCKITYELVDTKSELQYITDLAISPYISGDYIYMTESGVVNFSNMEMCFKICRKSMLDIPKTGMVSWSCQFASHPRCFVCSNDTEVMLEDLRIGVRQRVSIFNLNSKIMYKDEKVHCVKLSQRSSYLHYIGTSYSLHLLDERFPGHPVLTWKHQMTAPPLFCSVSSYLSKQSQTCEAVVIASYRSTSKELVLFTNQHEGHAKTISLAPPLHISAAGDFTDTLLQNCYSIDPMINMRTDYPLYGISCVTSQMGRITVLQQTTLGDVFYQDFEEYDREGGIPMELGHKQGPGYVACQLNEEVVKSALSWTETAIAQMLTRRGPPGCKQTIIDASDVMRVMTAIPDHTHGCPLCCHCTSANRINVNLTEICSACKIQMQFGKQLFQEAEQNGVLTGRLPENVNGHQVIPTNLPAGMKTIAEMSQSSDPMMKRFVNEWIKEEPVSDVERDCGDSMEVSSECGFLTGTSAAPSAQAMKMDKESEPNMFLTQLESIGSANMFHSQDLPLSSSSFPYPSTSGEQYFKQDESMFNEDDVDEMTVIEDPYFAETPKMAPGPRNTTKDSGCKDRSKSSFRGTADEGF